MSLIGKKFLSLLLALSIPLSLIPSSAFAQSTDVSQDFDTGTLDSNFMMTFKGSGTTTYLSTPGLDVFLDNTAFDRTFGDQKCAGMEMILQGQRVSTNGDIRLSPTPEQWDPVPTTISHGADKTNGCLVANESYSDYKMTYSLKVTPEPGGYKVSVNLDSPLPATLIGRAGFNMEFIPSIYKSKSYMVDSGSVSGIIPTSPSSQMQEESIPAGDPITRNSWQAEWDAERGDYQTTPIVTASNNITLDPEDPTTTVRVSSDSTPVSLYDGRNKAQNGWFVLRSEIPANTTTNAVVWHVRANVPKAWTQDPVVTYSQVGYIPNSQKVAVIQLDKNDTSAPTTASLDRLNDDGTYTTVFKDSLQAPIAYARYNYSKFDFSSTKTPGTYSIQYDGKRTDVFPITDNAYSNTWQSSLSTYLAEQMDHVEVSEGYKVWHGASHLDDARQAPANISWFDGWSMGSDLNSPYKAGDHIDGLNVGGWYDAGDFDIQTGSHITIVQNLAVAAKAFNLNYDNLTVDEAGRSVEMHKPDGIPDAVQQVKHGALQLLAQINSVGHTFNVIEVPTLHQYTHLGDGSTDTDNLIYSSLLGKSETSGKYSGIPDDRWAFTSSNLDSSAYVSLAAAAWALRGWDNDMYKKCLDAAVKIWNSQDHSSTTSMTDYSGAVFLMLATYDSNNPSAYAVYKNRISTLAKNLSASSVDPVWQSTLILPYMDSTFKSALETVVKNYIKSFDQQMASKPYGVPTSDGMWGGSESVCNLGKYMYFLHEAFPSDVSADYALRADNYILGTHPCSSLSYVCGVGKNSKVHAYSNTRSDDTYIPGGVIPGYCLISPDYPECIDNFGMLWFENETNTTDASAWVVAALGADTIASEESGKQSYAANFKVTDPTGNVEGAKIAITDGLTYQTDQDGEASLNLTEGNYSYTITKDGYKTVSGTFAVTNTGASVPVAVDYDLTPTSVTVNGTALQNFDASNHTYYMAASLIPTVAATSYDGVNVSVAQAESVPGTAVITLKRGGETAVYKINFEEPPKLNSLSVGGNEIDGFTPGNNNYFVQLPAGYSSFPTVTAKADSQYTVTVTQATPSTMAATVSVKDKNGIETIYTVSFGSIESIDFSTIKNVSDLNSAGWSIYQPNMKNVNFVDSGIAVTSEPGDWYTTTNTAKNIITCNDASGNWQAVLEVGVNKPFYDNFQQCALEAYKDSDNYVKLDTEYNSYSGGIRCQLGSESSSNFTSASNSAFKLMQGADGSYPIFYKLVKSGNTYLGFLSTDGVNYSSCGSTTNSMTNLKLGLAATNNMSTQPVTVTFKTLTITHPTASDKETLQNLYDAYSPIDKGDYTDASWAAFTTALANAKTVLESGSVTSYEISTCVTALTNAQSGLTKKSSPVATDKTALQSLYNTCKSVTQGNYTSASWAAFTTALKNAKAVLDNANATQSAIDQAVAALTAAKAGLATNSSSGSSSSGSSGGGSSGTTPAIPASPITATIIGSTITTSSGITFVTDTTTDVRVAGSYTAKLTSGNGQPPVVVIGTPGVFDVQISTTNGKDYFIKLIPIGQTPGAQAGVYLDGLKLFVATVEAPDAPSVRSDTTRPFTVRSGASYILKLTAGSRPTLVPGSAGAFKVEFIKSSGNEYFFRIVPTGKRGASTGLYINSGKVPVTIATVA